MASKWAVDYASISSKTKSSLADPFGFEAGALETSTGSRSTRPSSTEEHDDTAIKINRAWEVAWGPAKNIPMNAIMIYMTGNGVQIFSVMITAMLFMQPVKAIMSVQQTFSRFETKHASDLFLPKLIFIALHLLTMGIGVYKVNAMGLLPTTTSDWLGFLEPKKVLEYGVA